LLLSALTRQLSIRSPLTSQPKPRNRMIAATQNQQRSGRSR
jgi:hypothetical protein